MDNQTQSAKNYSSIQPVNNGFETARENSIEIYDDDKFVRNSILTRSARMRKFKFYKYKPIQDSKPAILVPRVEVIQGKIPSIAEQSKELTDLDSEIDDIEKRIADLDQSSANNDCDVDVNKNLDEKFELVNKKNDLLRRQMQLNILEQERALEKANGELTKELRSLMSLDDSRKTQAQLERQQYLYNESLALVNRRNELVLHLDYQEKEIEQDQAVKARLKSVISNGSSRDRSFGSNDNQDQKCIIQ